MRKFHIIAIIIALVLASCSAKEESPEPPKKPDNTNTGGTGGTGGGGGSSQPNLNSSSPVQFWGKIDGTVTHYQPPTYENYYDKDSTEGTDSTTAWYITGFIDPITFVAIGAAQGPLKYPKGTTPSGTTFAGLFTAGTYPIGPEAVEITLLEGPFSIWTTAEGDQTGSSFQIVDMIATGSTDDPKYKVVMKFNCKVYNSFNPSQSKTITEGIMVGEFVEQQ